MIKVTNSEISAFRGKTKTICHYERLWPRSLGKFGYANHDTHENTKVDIINKKLFIKNIRCSNRDGNIITVLGGHHVSAVREEVLEQSPNTDFSVIGEGEITFHELTLAFD